ncbi:MAG: flagellar hook-basal body complex protein [Bradyrhizobium sp.]|nr:flagellar hook-basal body complex protein [Bradyrhizobium sp.]
MGIFDALNTSVGGLQAQSFALQNISGNIANASTTGYKGINTSFEDLIPDATTPSRQVAGGVTAFAQATITTQGTVSASTVATNMAINGDGFFSVQASTGTIDNAPVFSGTTDYTRRGDFQVNANGNLVNGAGYYLMGVAVDPKTGNPLGNVPQVLQFQNNFVPAQATSAIQYAANLPTQPATTASTTASKGTLAAAGGLNPADFASNPLIIGTPATPYGDNTVTGSAALDKAGTGPITASTALSGSVGTATGAAATNTSAAPISGSTLLSGTSSNALTTSFAVNDTITVNGQTITFVASGASDNNHVNITDNITTLLGKIDALTGTANPSSVNGAGKVTLNNTNGTLSVSSSNTGAFAALGFAAPVTPPATALSASFVSGNTITVDTSPASTINFYNSAAGETAGAPAANTYYLDIATNTVGDLMNDIGTITGVAPTINASTGAITLHTGTAQDLTLSSTAGAFGALGFSSPMTARRTGGGTAGTGFVIGNDLTAFTNESISGGAITTYNSAGTPVNLQLRWAKTDSASLGNGHQDTWNLFYQTDPSATGTGVAWVNVGTNFTFNSDGSLSSPSGSSITIPNVTVSGQSLGNVSLNLGSGGLTQFASTGGTATINTISQNGYAAGQLQSVAINNNGLVVGTFSNGQNIDLASVTLSHFDGTNYLKALDGGAYAVTDGSGPAIAGASGTISGSSLEGSNTDIADEFTKLIVTQQAYSANTKVITTANDMVQSLLSVLR